MIDHESILKVFFDRCDLDDLPPVRTSLSVDIKDCSQMADEALNAYQRFEDAEATSIALDEVRHVESKSRKFNDDITTTRVTKFLLDECWTAENCSDLVIQHFRKINQSSHTLTFIARYAIKKIFEAGSSLYVDHIRKLKEYFNGKSVLETEYVTLVLALVPYEDNLAELIGLVPIESYLTLNDEQMINFIILQMQVLYDADTMLAESKSRRILGSVLEGYPILFKEYHSFLVKINTKLDVIGDVSKSYYELSKSDHGASPATLDYFARYVVTAYISGKHDAATLLKQHGSLMSRQLPQLYTLLLRISTSDIVRFPLPKQSNIEDIPTIQAMLAEAPSWKAKLEFEVKLGNLVFFCGTLKTISLGNLAELLGVQICDLHTLLEALLQQKQIPIKVNATDQILTVGQEFCRHFTSIQNWVETYSKTMGLIEETLNLIDKENLLV